MRIAHHIDGFIKEAQAALARPAGVGDAQRAMSGYNPKKQTYSQPQPPSAVTNTSQPSIQPPSVM